MPSRSKKEIAMDDVLPATLEALRTLGDIFCRQLSKPVRQRVICDYSGIHVSYFSQLMSGHSNVPSISHIEKLYQAFRRLQVIYRDDLHKLALTDVVEANLSEIQQRYSLTTPVLSPPNGIIDPTTDNYVNRWGDDAARCAGKPGYFIISGTPQTGRSSLARRVEQTASNMGAPVVYIDTRDLPPEPADVDELYKTILAKIRTATPGIGIYSILDTWLKHNTTHLPSVLIIDGVNNGSLARVRMFQQLHRKWLFQMRKIRPANPWHNLGLWMVTGSDIQSCEALDYDRLFQRSGLFDASWFMPAQIQTLSNTYPAPNQRTHKTWTSAVAKSAYELFAGQPMLTQQFIADCSSGHNPSERPKVDGIYRLHLESLSRLIQLDPVAVAALKQSRVSGEIPFCWTLFNLGVLDYNTNGWTNEFYLRHLPKMVE